MIRIEIDDDGTVRLSEGSSPVEAVDVIRFEFDRDGRGVRVGIRLTDLSKVKVNPDVCRREKIRLAKYPFVQVTDPNDTLPTGMPAIRVEVLDEG